MAAQLAASQEGLSSVRKYVSKQLQFLAEIYMFLPETAIPIPSSPRIPNREPLHCLLCHV
jgi:hypothetical protein